MDADLQKGGREGALPNTHDVQLLCIHVQLLCMIQRHHLKQSLPERKF